MPSSAARSSAPRATSVKNGLRTSSTTSPMLRLRPARSCRAASLRTKPSSSIAAAHARRWRVRPCRAGSARSRRFRPRRMPRRRRRAHSLPPTPIGHPLDHPTCVNRIHPRYATLETIHTGESQPTRTDDETEKSSTMSTTPRPGERVCFQLQVDPERLDDYRERHAAVWPEMLARDRGIRPPQLLALPPRRRPAHRLLRDRRRRGVAGGARGRPAHRCLGGGDGRLLRRARRRTPRPGRPRLAEVFHLEDQLAALDADATSDHALTGTSTESSDS